MILIELMKRIQSDSKSIIPSKRQISPEYFVTGRVEWMGQGDLSLLLLDLVRLQLGLVYVERAPQMDGESPLEGGTGRPEPVGDVGSWGSGDHPASGDWLVGWLVWKKEKSS